MRELYFIYPTLLHFVFHFNLSQSRETLLFMAGVYSSGSFIILIIN